MKKRWDNDEIGVLPTLLSAVCLGEIIRNAIHLPVWDRQPPLEAIYLHADNTDPLKLNPTARFRKLETDITAALA